ncbi:hypothetical protein E2320_008200, partial [Naja naja]
DPLPGNAFLDPSALGTDLAKKSEGKGERSEQRSNRPYLGVQRINCSDPAFASNEKPLTHNIHWILPYWVFHKSLTESLSDGISERNLEALQMQSSPFGIRESGGSQHSMWKPLSQEHYMSCIQYIAILRPSHFLIPII